MNHRWFLSIITEGAFLISSQKEEGAVRWVSITAEKGGQPILENPFATKDIMVKGSRKYKWDGSVLLINTKPEEKIMLKPKSIL